ncbi:Adenine phosphoribosyltransferase [invertebrate metagenome]|uniref:adenine phosphoribosyltransferase n=1 Tax=invertebrate metagenome TaxID=1711999 RepID=A0A484H5E0_9ZZZZ
MDLKDYIRGIPDFPKPGIYFYDISTLFAHPVAWQRTMECLAQAVRAHKPDVLAGIESRGLPVAASLALKLGCGFIMIRKKGKLPGPTSRCEYALEYGSDILEIQRNILEPKQRVVVLDDLLATGSTMNAAITLLKVVGVEPVAAACIIELAFLNGRLKLDVPCTVLVSYAR